MTWTDPRLNVTLPEDSPTEYIRFGDGVVKHIWFPDVYIDGIQDLRFPAYKQNPAYLRVYNTSKLKYSARVNYDVACPMHFEEYPMDTQRCNISFESWGHPCQYIILTWLREKRKFSTSISLAQFDLDVNFLEEPLSNFSSLGSYSRVTMQLVLTRKITYHLFRTYLPSGLFVIIGWFSLFIPLDHVPGRVTMGMTTLLTLAAMFSAIATTTPRVSYSSKLDVWMVFCVIFVFGTLLEFTLLIFLQKQVFATKLQRSLTAISMVRSQQRCGSINSGSGSGIGSQGMTAAAMIGGMAGVMGTSSVHSGMGMATTQTTPKHDSSSGCMMENDNGINGGNNERIQLTAISSDRKGGKIVSAQALGGQNRQRGRCRTNTFDFIGPSSQHQNRSNHVSLQPMIQPLQPSAAAQLASGVRREVSVDTLDNSEMPGGGPDPEYERLLAEEERQREILFTIERYGIVVFAIFFIFFNIFYWLHLLHSQIF